MIYKCYMHLIILNRYILPFLLKETPIVKTVRSNTSELYKNIYGNLDKMPIELNFDFLKANFMAKAKNSIARTIDKFYGQKR